MACRTYRGSLSLEMRVRVIKESEKGTSHRNLARLFGCGKTQIASILQHKDELLKEWEAVGKSDRFLRKPPSKVKRFVTKLLRAPPPIVRKKQIREQTARVNNLVWAWLRDANARCIPISGAVIKDKAIEYSRGLKFTEFQADDIWLDSFRRRHDIMSLTAYGNDNSDANSYVEWNIEALPTVQKYDPRNIYNFDETGLFFKEIPGKTLASKLSKCVGATFVNERFTICFCCNALGEKEPLLIISNRNQPSFLNERQKSSLGIEWRVDSNSWMNSAIFLEWLENFNEKMKQQNRKILLFVDTAPCHVIKPLSNIELQLIGPKRPIFLHPIAEGIAQSFKYLYRKYLMRYVFARMIAAEKGPSRYIDLMAVIRWMSKAWSEVKPETISKCFMMCGIAGKMTEIKIIWETKELSELEQLCSAVGINNVVADEQIDCYEDPSERWRYKLGENIFSGPSNLMHGTTKPWEFIEECGPASTYSIGEAFKAIDHLRVTFAGMGSEDTYAHVLHSLVLIEDTLEDILIKRKLSPY